MSHERVRTFGIPWSRGCTIAAILVSGCCFPVAMGQEKTKQEQADFRQRVEHLAAALDADREAERDDAEAQLLQLGIRAVRFLPPIDEGASPEWRMRIERVRDKLLAQDNERRMTPSRVSTRGTMTGREALESLSTSTGNTIPLPALPELEETIELDLEEVSFWEAIDEILDKLGLTLAPNDSEPMTLVRRDPASPVRVAMAAYAGSFRLEPIAIDKSLQLFQPALSSTTIQICLAWEPRLAPAYVHFPLENLELLCDNGELLRPKPNQGSDFLPSGSQLVASLEFDRPTRVAREIVRWQGTIQVTIPGEPVALEFSDLDTARNAKISSGDLSVTLERSRKNRDIREVLLGVAMRGLSNPESLQGWTSLIEASMLNPEGESIEHAGWSTTRVTDSDLGLSFLFDIEDELAGYRFVFRAPQSVLQQTVEYSLEHVPLP